MAYSKQNGKYPKILESGKKCESDRRRLVGDSLWALYGPQRPPPDTAVRSGDTSSFR